MRLSVIVPVYNESATIVLLLKKLLKVRQIKEIVVVNDGSTDDTLKKVAKVKSRKLHIYSKRNGGKGSAVRFGLKKVTGDYVLIQDADLEYDPADITLLLQPIEKGRVQVVYGSRFTGPHSNLLFWHRLGNTFLNLITNLLYNTTLSDLETCYKILPTKLLRSLDLQANSFELEPEITCKLLRQGIHIFEVPISYVGRGHDEGKKINWYDGLAAVRTIVTLRF